VQLREGKNNATKNKRGILVRCSARRVEDGEVGEQKKKRRKNERQAIVLFMDRSSDTRRLH
jgi:hypothetical protein